MGIFRLILLILELVTAWKVFEKYGEAGWKGLIPFYSDYIEYGKVWNVSVGIVYIVCVIISNINVENKLVTALASAAGIAYFVINILFANKKAQSFGKGIGMTLLLIFFPFIGNLVLGFGDSVYLGNTSR